MNPIENQWRKAMLLEDASIAQAVANLDQTAIRIVLVVNAAGVLIGTLSDGDIRRGLLKGLGMQSPIANIVNRAPFVVPPDLPRELILELMLANKIQQIPIIDGNRQVVGLHRWDALNVTPVRANTMVIMAGGMGTRLRPHTENCPKPLLLVAGKPMLTHIIERAKHEGFSRFVLAVHYLGHLIEEHFGDGESLGVHIDYLRETSPLGTAGALSLLTRRPDAPFVVTNGDVITDIRYGELLDFHIRHGAAATMAVRLYEWQHPFGVVQTRGVDIVGFEEKPVARSHINAGVYAFNSDALSELIVNERCDMPTLFERLQVRNRKTVAYPMHEPWLDVGRPDDLASARAQITKVT